MRRGCRILTAFLSCVVLSACTTTLHGYQSSSVGSTTTVTSASVAASASSSNASVSFVSGPRVPANNAPGGQLTLSSGSAGALGVAVIIGVLASYIVEEEGPTPLPAGTRLLHTCSCYQPLATNEPDMRKE